MFLMGEKKLARLPDEHEIYTLSLRFNRLPDEIRMMPIDDRNWLRAYLLATDAAAEEIRRRKSQ